MSVCGARQWSQGKWAQMAPMSPAQLQPSSSDHVEYAYGGNASDVLMINISVGVLPVSLSLLNAPLHRGGGGTTQSAAQRDQTRPSSDHSARLVHGRLNRCSLSVGTLLTSAGRADTPVSGEHGRARSEEFKGAGFDKPTGCHRALCLPRHPAETPVV
ncbi:hypothetical protein AAFF_G00341630 [Aldrovandia affinis]|uniref:Uncharacterized protein n=1 Tax=Aldrovandia affinis TaxID=143900 RepID=A0AAD7SKN4_9TELE|nr:hypothetical protein AAFF_G00341630 [Aldrovandia affinis]